MSSVFSILLVIILNLMPAGTDKFTIQMPEGMGDKVKIVRFSKEADGWHAVAQEDFQLGTFVVNGTELTAKREGKEFTQDLGKLLGIDAKTDWNKVAELKLAGVPLKIQRLPEGADFTMVGKNADGQPIERTFKARWVPLKK